MQLWLKVKLRAQHYFVCIRFRKNESSMAQVRQLAASSAVEDHPNDEATLCHDWAGHASMSDLEDMGMCDSTQIRPCEFLDLNNNGLSSVARSVPAVGASSLVVTSDVVGASLAGASPAAGDSGCVGASLSLGRSSAARRRRLRERKIRHDLGMADPVAAHSASLALQVHTPLVCSAQQFDYIVEVVNLEACLDAVPADELALEKVGVTVVETNV